jgi:hypothetical protein
MGFDGYRTWCRNHPAECGEAPPPYSAENASKSGTRSPSRRMSQKSSLRGGKK